jgi:tetratricopeptide (TPR) repeat protein
MAVSDSPSVQEIRAALDRIQRWPDIARSPQLSNFLAYIIEQHLAGNSHNIKAYAIAVDVFGRPPDFDPQADPIVRVQARRLRTALADYYKGPGREEPWQILLPVGRYVPEIRANIAQRPPENPVGEPIPASPMSSSLPQPRYRIWSGPIVFTLLVLLGVGVVAMVLVLSARPVPPSIEALAEDGLNPPEITIVQIQNLTGDDRQDAFLSGLAIELVTDLDLFHDLTVRLGNGDSLTVGDDSEAFVLTGIARQSDETFQYSAILTNRASQELAWSRVFERPHGSIESSNAVDDLSRDIAIPLASPRGPLHAAARNLVTSDAVAGRESIYLCLVSFSVYRDSRAVADAERAERCFAALPETDRQDPRVIAASAMLLVELAVRRGEPLSEKLATADTMVSRALSEDAVSSFIWEQRARLYARQGLIELARTAYTAAYQLNPANTDAIASHAMLLAMRGGWEEAARIVAPAIEDTPQPPPDWYFGAPAIAAYRSGQFREALGYAEIYARADRPLGSVLAMLAGFNGGDGDAVNRYLPQVLELDEFEARGIMPTLNTRLADPVLLGDIRKGLIEAGVNSAVIEGR